MTTLVGIVGKQTVQRISIRFPKREGQSRIRILFLSSLARTLIKSCKDTLSGFAECLQVIPLSAHVLGLAVGVYGHHTDRREMKCPTKVLKDLTK